MSVQYMCDRCGDVDEMHARSVTVEFVGPFPTMSDRDRESLHLCGHCTDGFREFMRGATGETAE